MHDLKAWEKVHLPGSQRALYWPDLIPIRYHQELFWFPLIASCANRPLLLRFATLFVLKRLMV